MDQNLAYQFDEIEYSIHQEIHTTATRLHAALEELRSQIAPLHDAWTREAGEAFRVEQLKWHRAAGALTEILAGLGNAVRDGAADIAGADHHAAAAWGR